MQQETLHAAQDVEVRRVSEEAIGQIRAVAAVAFPATYRELLTSAQLDYMMEWMYSVESLRAQFRAGHVWFMAFACGEPCGYVSVERQGEALFHLQKIYVLPRFQGLGIGARLFRQAVAHVRAEHPGHSLMELNVNRRNPALHFYERMGMRRLREGDFPIGGGFYMNDYIMGLEIE
ncbi:GNAT family N-acetyltransferase [Alistipes sp.]|uniref:GNAT family N-acetyltransferase n=1 Tax=Alistipes sp. TaxID=1872444 RepID=UPI0025BAC092|nr:GNAT family N-acetyltransferase [Alistipes sp.]MCI7139871.1 GNAT family N-acetyltransferase [Alistipes sp.]MDY5396950.1 GNAT family N-acetyltransferase [Alistipes sp.]